jgi:phospholipid-binding lipoprotein MlaA
MRLSRLFLVAVCAFSLGGCATASKEALANNDPFEPFNRAMYRFDQKFDKYVILPVAGVYILYTPKPIHNAIHNFFLNLDLPMVFANQTLQGKFGDAGRSLGRLTLNSTIGLGGFVDVATKAGLPYKDADFGQTLGQYGVPEGPFLVLPLIGPDPPRDLVGDVVDLTLNPLLYLPPAAPLYVRAIDTTTIHIAGPFDDNARNMVLRQELSKGSVDTYVTMRSVYRQLRSGQTNGGLPDIGGTPSPGK